MEEEKKGKIYIVGDTEKIDFEKSGNDFDIMPDEFFNSQYQQSRVRKEQQLQKEKDLIDKKKREKEERLKKLAELEKQAKEKDDLKKERLKIKEQEKLKRQEEIDAINKKRKEEQEILKKEEERLRAEREESLKRKNDKARRLRELDQKAKEERKSLKKQQKELLKQELERRAEILKSQNQNVEGVNGTKEIEKALAKDRVEILKKIRLEQKINLKEQKRIKREIKEEEAKKARDEREAMMAKAKLSMGKSSNSLDLSFVDGDDNRLNVINKSKAHKKIVFISLYTSLSVCFMLFVFVQTKIINFPNTNKGNPAVVINNNSGITDGPRITDDVPKKDNVDVNNGTENPSTDSLTDNITAESGNVLSYTYKYSFSRFFDFFKYSINNDTIGNYLSGEEKILYKTNFDVLDSDDDGHIDGDEVVNLYDPAKKDPSLSPDLRLIESNKILSYKDKNIEFNYPNGFLAPIVTDSSISVYPKENADEYFKLDFINYDSSIIFSDFLKQQDPDSANFYRIRNFVSTINNNFFVNSSGDKVYLDLHNGYVLKISYIKPPLVNYNYAATFLMFIKSIPIM